MTPEAVAQWLLLTAAAHYTPERGVIVLAWVIGSLLLCAAGPAIWAKVEAES